MKNGKRLASLALALIMIFGLMAGASAASTQEEIQAYLNYDVTVTYNGEAQAMTDATGSAVYPISYKGTTYLPVRAVSNMLGVAVDWDGETQTVLLSDPADGRTAAKNGSTVKTVSGQKEIQAYLASGITVKYNGEVQAMTDAAGNTVYPVSYEGTTYLPVRAVSNMLGVAVDWDGETQTVLLGEKTGNGSPAIDPATDVFSGAKTSEHAKVLGKDHIGSDYAEIDWSTVKDGYIKVTVYELPGPSARIGCDVRGDDNGQNQRGEEYLLTEGEWNIPLYHGDVEYVANTSLTFLACEHYMTEGEKQVNDAYSEMYTLQARFNAKIENPDNIWLLSTPLVNFNNAPETCKKAQELTKDCETDAEKITAIFTWVAKNVKYDYKEVARMDKAHADAIKNADKPPCIVDEKNGLHDKAPDGTERYTNQNQLDLDLVLSKKTGVCGHYAALTAGMLRSVGIPCQVVSGQMKINGDWVGHAWIAVKPETGTLDKNKLGAGNDHADVPLGWLPEYVEQIPTGWTRLDPTNGMNGTGTAKDDKNYVAYSHK